MKYQATLALAIPLIVFAFTCHAQENDSILVDEYITSQEFIEAEVISVRASQRTITVRGAKRGKTRQFKVPEGTKITIAGRNANLRDIRRGDLVLLAMKPETEEVVISRIRVPNTETSLETRQAEPISTETIPTILPATASHWPTVLLLGFFALFCAICLRLWRKQMGK